MVPVQFETAQKEQVRMFVDSITIEAPQNIYGKKIYPTECRQLKSTYGGSCNVRIGFSVNSGHIEYVDVDMGEFPIMIRVRQVTQPFIGPKIYGKTFHFSRTNVILKDCHPSSWWTMENMKMNGVDILL